MRALQINYIDVYEVYNNLLIGTNHDTSEKVLLMKNLCKKIQDKFY